MHILFDTSDSKALAFQRAILALVIGAHGVQKAFGWFGGFGFEGTMRFFTDTLHVPAALGLLVILGETLGAVGLVLGAGTRVAAGGVTATMIGAVAMVHWRFGFFMNWGGSQGGEGFELHLLALGLSLPLVLLGGGAWSVDRVVAARRQLEGRSTTVVQRAAKRGAELGHTTRFE
jgi:putative oxidoreductase